MVKNSDRNECRPRQQHTHASRPAKDAQVTLAATYQVRRDLITIPNLILDLQDHRYQNAIAKDREVGCERVQEEVARATKTYERICGLTIFGSLKKLRNNVIAHHASDDGNNGSTQGPLNRLLIRTVILVDHLSIAVHGEITENKLYFREVLHQGVGFWSKGIDGDPFDPENVSDSPDIEV